MLFLPPFSMGLNSCWKEFAPQGASSSLKRRTDYGRDPSFKEATWKSQKFWKTWRYMKAKLLFSLIISIL